MTPLSLLPRLQPCAAQRAACAAAAAGKAAFAVFAVFMNFDYSQNEDCRKYND